LERPLSCIYNFDTMHRTTSEEWVEATSRQLAEELKAVGPSTTEELADEKEPQCELDSPEEKARLEELRAALDPSVLEKASEEMLLLTLRGRRYCVQEAAARLPLYLQLREEYKLDEYSDQLQKDVACGKVIATGSRDTAGRPILLCRMRYHDASSSDTSAMVRVMLFTLELMLKDPVAQQLGVTVINDCEGLTTAHMDFEVLKVFFTGVFKRFPGRVGVVLVVNPPVFVQSVLSWFVQLLRPRTQKRVKVVANYGDLKEYVASDQLPMSYGGTLGGLSSDALLACLSMQQAAA